MTPLKHYWWVFFFIVYNMLLKCHYPLVLYRIAYHAIVHLQNVRFSLYKHIQTATKTDFNYYTYLSILTIEVIIGQKTPPSIRKSGRCSNTESDVAYSLAKENNPEGICCSFEMHRAGGLERQCYTSFSSGVSDAWLPATPTTGRDGLLYLYSLTVAAVLCGSVRNYSR